MKVPGVVRTDVTIETLAVPEMVPGATGLAASHEPPDTVATLAVNAMPEVPVTLMDCAAGTAPPMVYAKVSEEGAAVTLLPTTMVTFTTCDVAFAFPMVTVPV